MKRTDITELFPEASKEAIDKLMGINGADVNAAKAEADTLRRQLTEAGSNELQKAQQQIGDLTKELNSMKAAETLRKMRNKVAEEKKVPVRLLTGETEEACAAQADAILEFAKPTGYPRLRDSGEVSKAQTSTTREKFADWAKENL